MTLPHIHLDFETRGAVDLLKCGLRPYIEHSSFGVWCLAFSFDDEPVDLIPREELNLGYSDLFKHIESGALVFAHNAAFEFDVWNRHCAPVYGWPTLKLEQMRCTMAMSYAMSLPGSLDKAAKAVQLPIEKDDSGRRVMLQLSKPRKRSKCERCNGTGLNARPWLAENCDQCNGAGEIYTWWDAPDKIKNLYDYCKQDVHVERMLAKRLRALSPYEQRIWQVDQKINARGIPIDVPSIEKAKRTIEQEKKRLDGAMSICTNGAVTSCSEVQRLTLWLELQGVPVKTLAKADLACLLKQELSGPARQAALLRQEAAKTSTAKLTSLLAGADSRNRVSGAHQYHGAGTGRWAGRRIQPQNIVRPKIPQDVIDEAMGYLDNPAMLALTTDLKPTDAIASCLRAMIAAPHGCALSAVDYAAIEARGLPWLANDQPALDEFESFDAGTGPEPYCIMAGVIYNKQIYKDEHPNERQVGKVTILQLGYQGGIGAWSSAASAYGIDLEAMAPPVLATATEFEQERARESAHRYFDATGKSMSWDAAMACDVIKQRFRDKRQTTEQHWFDLENEAMNAINDPGRAYNVGKVAYKKDGSFLWCQLPSGRVLCYPYPRVQMVKVPWGEKIGITYMGIDPYTRQWKRLKTYGGKLAENNTQAVCRDLLADALLKAENANLHPIMHVHDEIVIESPLDNAESDYRKLLAIMHERPEWATGFPIAAEGWTGKRYRKA